MQCLLLLRTIRTILSPRCNLTNRFRYFIHRCHLSDSAKHQSSKPWRFAASVILVVPCHILSALEHHLPVTCFRRGNFQQDLSVLLLKRPNSHISFSNKVVFPGGVLDNADQSGDLWSSFPKFLTSVPTAACYTPPVYRDLLPEGKPICRCRTEDSRLLHPSISLRICAIRELFEETGILLIYGSHFPSTDAPGIGIFIPSPEELEFWVPRLMEHPEELASVYSHFNVHPPPLDKLYDWSNWLTPSHFSSRYDTCFFFAGIQSISFSNSVKTSTAGRKWSSAEISQLYLDSPAAFLSSAASMELFVVPQLYELGRLAQYSLFSQLTAFAENRASLGMQRWCPIVVGLDNPDNFAQPDRVILLPGDQRYPSAAQCLIGMRLSLTDIAVDSHRNRLLLPRTCNRRGHNCLSPTDCSGPVGWFDTNFYELGHVLPISWLEYKTRFLHVELTT